jgi:hypothetical protein
MNDIVSEIDAMKAAREAEYKKILSSLSKEKYDSKLNIYKLNSAIKHESHIRNEKQSELQTQLSTLHTTVDDKGVERT